MRPIRHLSLLACLAAFTMGAAQAQDYPNKPIRVIVANSPGGTSDIFMRALADEFQKRVGQPMIIENRSGGGMNIAGKACADSPNDGYTICMLPGETLVLNEFTFKSIPYDPHGFEPITNCFINTQVFVVSSQLGVNTLPQLADYSKKNPGKLNYTALSIGMRIMLDDWARKTSADIIFVPARGGGDIVNGLLSGTSPVAIVGLPNFIPFIQEKKVVALAVDSEKRSPLFPDVPTTSELGLKKTFPVFFGLVAPAGTPAAIVEKLHTEIRKIGEDPKFRQARLLDIGIVPVFDTPKEFGAFIAGQREEARQLIKESGFSPQ